MLVTNKLSIKRLIDSEKVIKRTIFTIFCFQQTPIVFLNNHYVIMYTISRISQQTRKTSLAEYLKKIIFSHPDCILMFSFFIHK